ncbi:unnamed protein product [Taenia asiatica]|uniref:DUF5737 domain-containing protein n=1 Tax=Taenia asiatica TaxID=60517 RepID=A0A0R3W4N8_TAEAS|nr:unnamed protein product [Taenia asiatica]
MRLCCYYGQQECIPGLGYTFETAFPPTLIQPAQRPIPAALAYQVMPPGLVTTVPAHQRIRRPWHARLAFVFSRPLLHPRVLFKQEDVESKPAYLFQTLYSKHIRRGKEEEEEEEGERGRVEAENIKEMSRFPTAGSNIEKSRDTWVLATVEPNG